MTDGKPTRSVTVIVEGTPPEAVPPGLTWRVLAIPADPPPSNLEALMSRGEPMMVDGETYTLVDVKAAGEGFTIVYPRDDDRE